MNISLVNSHSESLALVVEPWGDRLSLDEGAVYKISAADSDMNNLELEFAAGSIIVWAPAGSLLRVSQGDEVVLEETVRFPKPPAGMTTREFLRSVFG